MRRLSLTLLVLLGSGCADSPPEKVDGVVLVTIDTLRADHLGAYGAEIATPHLDRLSRDGTVFLTAIAHSPLTLPSHSSILTGTYPTYHGVRDNGRYRLPDPIDTLAEMLSEAGYSTAAFVGAYPLHSRFGLNQGFDHYDDRFNRSPASLAFAERRAEDVVGAAKDWIRNQTSAPYFVWVHLFDPHAPYESPEPFRSQYGDSYAYAGEIAYVDHALEGLFSVLGDDVLTIVTADHGEGLGEHGEETHSLFIYNSTLRVPLIFRGPGVPDGEMVRQPVRTIDILPSVLELVGEEDACSACQGESLVGLMQGRDGEPRASYAETYFPRLNLGWSELRSVQRDGWKYVAAPAPELYALGVDPGELENLAASKPEKLKELAAELSALESATAASFAESSGSRPDPTTLSVLRSLGYLSTGKAPDIKGPLPDPKAKLDVWRKFRRGMDLVGRGEFDDAIAELEGVLQEDEDFSLARSYLAGAYFKRGHYQAAAAQCGKILSDDPNNFEAALTLGSSLMRLGGIRGAREALEQAAQIDPTSAAPLAMLANLLLREGERASARDALARAKERDADAPEVLLVEGKLHVLEGRQQEAEDSFRGAISATSWQEEPRVQLANLLLGQRRLGEAEELLREGLSRHPQSAPLYLVLGNCLALGGRMQEAIPPLEKALELAPDAPMVLNSLAFAYMENKEVEQGLALLRRSLEKDPNQPELKSFLEGLRTQ
jgi:arylsulfatase A-like enzyme/Flp pilus assembly protein TadD